MGDVSLAFNLIGKDRLTPTLAKASGAVRASALSSAASTVALGAAFASAAAWAVSLGAAAAASLGIIPSLAGAAAASVIGMKVATFGLGEAWKATSAAMVAGGGGGENAAKRLAAAQKQVTSAQEALTRAQRDARLAELALVDAREAETKRLRDLSLSLRHARIDEQQSVQAVRDALTALNAARRSGDANEIRRATLAYREAVLSVEDAKNRTADLTEEQDKAAKVGVEGSDAVTQAQQRLADATKAVADATERLADAQRNMSEGAAGGGGGIDAAAAAMAKLAPSAQALIKMLHQIGPAWTGVRKAMQEATFAGVAGDIKRLSDAYLPVMTARLTQMGAAFNNAIHQSLGLAASKKFVADVDTSLGNTNKALGILGASFAPLLSALTQMGAVGSQFLPQIAGWIQSIAERFERWVIAARASGRLQQWIGTGVSALRELGIVADNVLGIVAAIFRGGGADSGVGLLTTLANATGKMREFLNSAQGQEAVSRVMGDLRNILAAVGDVLPVVVGHAHEFSDTLAVAGTVLHFLADNAGLVAAALPYIAAGYLLVKTASVAHTAVEVVKLPVMLAQVAANWRLGTALRANTVALIANTGATTASDVVQKRSLASSIAMRAAAIAGAAATGIATAAQWLWNIAVRAFPLIAIISAIILIVAGIVWLWNNCAWFRTAVMAVWNAIKDFFLGIGHWFAHDFVDFFVSAYRWIMNKAQEWHAFVVGKFNALVAFVTSIPARIRAAASGMWNGIVDAFRGALNWIISAWNRLQFRIPAVNFLGFHVPEFNLGVPKIPMLAAGGHVTHGGLAVVGERGAEVVDLPTGSTVYPNGAGAAGRFELVAAATGDQLIDGLIRALRLRIRSEGGDVQAVLGVAS